MLVFGAKTSEESLKAIEHGVSVAQQGAAKAKRSVP